MATTRPLRTPRLDLNPSSADRWTTCTASPSFILANADKLPAENRRFADPGTTAHEVASSMLLGQEPNPDNCPVPIDEDMRWHGWNYMEYVSGLRKQFSTLLVEKKLPLFYMEGRNAIIDAAVINPQEIHIIDFKYGEGVAVHPEGNLQATIYAAIVAKKQPPMGHEFPIFIHIYQPRGRNAENGPAHVWETTWGEIQKAAEFIEYTAAQIQTSQPGASFLPSEKACQWCAAKGFCTARQESLTREIDAFEVLTVPEAKLPLATTLTPEQIAAVLKHKKAIVKWMNDVEEYATSSLTAGNPVPGFKLVLSRGGHRYWTNPVRAAKLLVDSTHLRRDEVIEEKTITPAAVEKLLGKGKMPVDVMELIAKPSGVPEIAPEGDKREALGNEVDEFEVITGREEI